MAGVHLCTLKADKILDHSVAWQDDDVMSVTLTSTQVSQCSSLQAGDETNGIDCSSLCWLSGKPCKRLKLTSAIGAH